MSAKDPAKRLVVHDVNEARTILPRSITLANSYLNPASFRKEFKNTVYHKNTAPLEHAVDPRAEDRAMKDVAVPERYRLASNALFDDIGTPVIPLIRSHFVKEGRLTVECALDLIKRTKEIVKAEPNVVTVHPPTVVVGDIHGQFFDLLSIFEIAGNPPETQFVFMGDYVDRGDFSTETIFYLCAMKVLAPERVTLLRGNHESRLMGEYMTFLLECQHKYTAEVFDAFMDLFDCLPICAHILDSAYGNCLCVHGGIGPEVSTLEQINNLDRFRELPSSGPICDLVWSDPVDDYNPLDDAFAGMTNDQWDGIEFLPNTIRHSSVQYGMKAVASFCDDNDLCCIIRGHQVQQEGYKEHFVTEEDPIAMVLTIFSAPDYCGEYGNKGAFLLVMKDRFEVQQIRAVQHPFYLPDFADGITFSIPVLLENIVGILQQLVLELKMDPETLTDEEKKSDEALAVKTKALLERNSKIVAEREKYRKVLSSDYHKNMALFLDVLRNDAANEAYPVMKKRATGGGASLKRCSSGFL